MIMLAPPPKYSSIKYSIKCTGFRAEGRGCSEISSALRLFIAVESNPRDAL